MMLRFTFDAKSPISSQIYSQVKDMIHAGILAPGERLPSSRELAQELKLSRNTVLSAYDWLISEGYAISHSTAGTYISSNLFFPGNFTAKAKDTVDLLDENAQRSHSDTISFETGAPALDLVPKRMLGSMTKNIFLNAHARLFNTDCPEGRPELRNAICKYLYKARNIKCAPDEIMITSGTKQAMALIAKCLLTADSHIVIEDPTFTHIRKIFGFHCDTFYPVPADTQGMITSMLPRDIRPDIVFTTPSHQIPFGGVLPLQRRLELLKYAYDRDCYIIEDDYDSEFNYDNKFISTIKELDPHNQFVIYAGTFSKVLYPSLRVGYLLLPETLFERFREVKQLGDQHTNTINQLVVAKFMEDGHLAKHILKMKRIYKRRRDFLIKAIEGAFGDSAEVLGSGAGMHIVVKFKDVVFTKDVIGRIRKNGVVLSPAIEDVAHIKGKHLGEILLGYTNLSEEQIAKGVQILKRTVGTH